MVNREGAKRNNLIYLRTVKSGQPEVRFSQVQMIEEEFDNPQIL